MKILWLIPALLLGMLWLRRERVKNWWGGMRWVSCAPRYVLQDGGRYES